MKKRQRGKVRVLDLRDTRLTEAFNPRTAGIDDASPLDIVRLLNEEDRTVASAVVGYSLSEEAMAALTAQPATKFTMTTAGEPIEVEMHKKSFKDFINDIGCITSVTTAE